MIASPSVYIVAGMVRSAGQPGYAAGAEKSQKVVRDAEFVIWRRPACSEVMFMICSYHD
jgi:hypothetical protein